MSHVIGVVPASWTRDALLLGFSVRCLSSFHVGGFDSGLQGPNFAFQTLDFTDRLVKIGTELGG